MWNETYKKNALKYFGGRYFEPNLKLNSYDKKHSWADVWYNNIKLNSK
jgi:hypothetical protein